MTNRSIDDLTPEEALAEDLVDRALRGMVIPADLLPVIRVTLIGELLTTDHGRAQLRRAAADPTVSSSGDVAKPGASVPKAKARVGGKPAGRRGGGRS